MRSTFIQQIFKQLICWYVCISRGTRKREEINTYVTYFYWKLLGNLTKSNKKRAHRHVHILFIQRIMQQIHQKRARYAQTAWSRMRSIKFWTIFLKQSHLCFLIKSFFFFPRLHLLMCVIDMTYVCILCSVHM